MKKVLTAGLSPAIQKTIIFERLSKGEVNRASEYLIDAAGKSINVCRVLTQAGINAEALVPVGVESRERFEALCRRDSIAITACVTQGRV
jgi:fructose-1-phosphate kinase PfkB-like protein